LCDISETFFAANRLTGDTPSQPITDLWWHSHRLHIIHCSSRNQSL